MIVVTLTSSKDNRINLDFSDNGVGLPQGFCIEMYKCLGLQLVSNLVQDDLNGVFSLSTDDRTTARIEFRA
jgi:two-component sensor histidine kinase